MGGGGDQRPVQPVHVYLHTVHVTGCQPPKHFIFGGGAWGGGGGGLQRHGLSLPRYGTTPLPFFVCAFEDIVCGVAWGGGSDTHHRTPMGPASDTQERTPTLPWWQVAQGMRVEEHNDAGPDLGRRGCYSFWRSEKQWPPNCDFPGGWPKSAFGGVCEGALVVTQNGSRGAVGIVRAPAPKSNRGRTEMWGNWGRCAPHRRLRLKPIVLPPQNATGHRRGVRATNALKIGMTHRPDRRVEAA